MADSRDLTPIAGETAPPYFFGVSKCWQDIAEDAFASPDWIEHCEAVADRARSGRKGGVARSLKALARKRVRGGDVPKYLQVPLKFLRARLRAQSELRVLDVGGGYGDNYELVGRALGAAAWRLSWHVVDNQRSADLGRELYAAKYSRLTLDTEIGEGEYELATVIGTLQYIQDWRGLLVVVANHGHPHIFIAHADAGRRAQLSHGTVRLARIWRLGASQGGGSKCDGDRKSRSCRSDASNRL